jgi:hypothetical protein
MQHTIKSDALSGDGRKSLHSASITNHHVAPSDGKTMMRATTKKLLVNNSQRANFTEHSDCLNRNQTLLMIRAIGVFRSCHRIESTECGNFLCLMSKQQQQQHQLTWITCEMEKGKLGAFLTGEKSPFDRL